MEICEYCGKSDIIDKAGLKAHQRRSAKCKAIQAQKLGTSVSNASQSTNKGLVKFQSNSARLKLTLRPSNYEYNKWGKRVKVPGIHAIFNNGFFETSNPDLIEYIRSHRYFIEKGKPVLAHNEEGVYIFEMD